LVQLQAIAEIATNDAEVSAIEGLAKASDLAAQRMHRFSGGRYV
jgi:hypothetical protein